MSAKNKSPRNQSLLPLQHREQTTTKGTAMEQQGREGGLLLDALLDVRQRVERVLANGDLERHFNTIEAKRHATAAPVDAFKPATVAVIGEGLVGKSTLIKCLLAPEASYDSSVGSSCPTLVRLSHSLAGDCSLEVRTSSGREVVRRQSVKPSARSREIGAFILGELRSLSLGQDEYVVITLSQPLPCGPSFELLDTPTFTGTVAASLAVRAALQEADAVLLVASCATNRSKSSQQEVPPTS
jgi:hypothetical protein